MAAAQAGIKGDRPGPNMEDMTNGASTSKDLTVIFVPLQIPAGPELFAAWTCPLNTLPAANTGQSGADPFTGKEMRTYSGWTLACREFVCPNPESILYLLVCITISLHPLHISNAV
jgi:hypothetical protein